MHSTKTNYLTMLLFAISLICACDSGNESNFSGGTKLAVPQAEIDENNGDAIGVSDGGDPIIPSPPPAFTPGGVGGINGAIETIEQFTGSANVTQAATVPEIAIIFDTSGSMRAEQTNLEQNMGVFIDYLNTRLTDFRVYLIAEAINIPQFNNPNKYIYVNKRVNSTDALQIMLNFLRGQLQNPVPLDNTRPLHAVIVSDDNSFMSAHDFHNQIQSEFPNRKISINGLIGLPTSPRTVDCSVARVGTVYQALAGGSDYPGVILDLCTPSWNDLLRDLAQFIEQSTPKSSFELSQQPDLASPIKLFVDNVLIPPSDYVLAGKTLSFLRNVPGDSADIKIHYSYFL